MNETPIFGNILEANDQTEARQEHLAKLRELVGNVYPNKFVRSQATGGEDTITAIVRDDKFRTHIPVVAEGEKPTSEQLAAANQELNRIKVSISGRIATPPRIMGKAAFVHLSDGIERLQIYVRRDDVRGVSNDSGGAEPNGWEMFKLFDHGDFIGVTGFLFVTKTGELSVHVETLQFLAKALLPMPDKLQGIADPEIRQRQRYADLIAGSLKVEREPGELSTREVFERRSKIIRELRRFLDDHGYIEVETPMLTAKATGAAAKPFETFHEALKIPLFARVAPELYLKRLTVGGFEKVYELNRNFRNEGISFKHNPEFTMLEFYAAYMDVNGMMDFAEKLIRNAVMEATGGNLRVLNRNTDPRRWGIGSGYDVTIDFSSFLRMPMEEAIVQSLPSLMDWYFKTAKPSMASNISDWLIDEIGEDHITWFTNGSNSKMLLRQLQWLASTDNLMNAIYNVEDDGELTEVAEDETFARICRNLSEIASKYDGLTLSGIQVTENILNIFDDHVENVVGVFKKERKLIVHPTFITNYPKSISPLSKSSPNNPAVAERFELFINGMECANGFSELNDPQEQYERFLDQARQRERGDDEAMVLDEDYIRALAYGMPPAAGIGIGIDRLVMLLTNRRSIRDVILFPHLRPERKVGEEADDT